MGVLRRREEARAVCLCVREVSVMGSRAHVEVGKC